MERGHFLRRAEKNGRFDQVLDELNGGFHQSARTAAPDTPCIIRKAALI